MVAQIPFLDLASVRFSTRSKDVAAARGAHWCAQTPYGLAVLRHREVGQLLRDRRLRQGSHAWPDLQGARGSFADFWTRSIISREGPFHKALRHIAVPALRPDFVDSLIPLFDRIAERLCENLKNRTSCEFQDDFAVPFAGQAICVLLGLDPGEWPAISRDASDLGLAMGVEYKLHEETVNAACDRLMTIAELLIAKVRSGEDQTSYVARLTAGFDRAEGLNKQALRDLVVISIFGGVDTTRSQLGLGMALFVENPTQWQALRNDEGLVPAAIEEMVRARPTTTWVTREAIEDFDFGGQKISNGTTLHLLVHASARDPLVDSDTKFDITAPRHMHFGFGGGAHHCLGNVVARTDMAAALRALRRTLASFEFDGAPVFLPDSGNTSPVRLPLKYMVAS